MIFPSVSPIPTLSTDFSKHFYSVEVKSFDFGGRGACVQISDSAAAVLCDLGKALHLSETHFYPLKIWCNN